MKPCFKKANSTLTFTYHPLPYPLEHSARCNGREAAFSQWVGKWKRSTHCLDIPLPSCTLYLSLLRQS